MAANGETSHGSTRDEHRGRDTGEAVERTADCARKAARRDRDTAHEPPIGGSGCVELGRDSHRPIFVTDALVYQ